LIIFKLYIKKLQVGMLGVFCFLKLLFFLNKTHYICFRKAAGIQDE